MRDTFYDDIIRILKSDAKKVIDDITKTTDTRAKIDKMRILKDNLDLVYKYDHIKDEISYEKDEHGFIDYYSMFTTLYNNGFKYCIFSPKINDERNRATSKTFSLLKFASDNNAYFIVNSHSNGKYLFNREKDIIDTRNIKFVTPVDLRGVNITENDVICLDEGTNISNEDIEYLKDHANVFGFRY